MLKYLIALLVILAPFPALATRDAEINAVFKQAGVARSAVEVRLEPANFFCGAVLAVSCYRKQADCPFIRIAQNLAPRDFEFALLHEIGHHLTAYSVPKEEWEAAANKFAYSKMTPVFKPRYSFKKLGTYKLNIK